VLNTGVTVGAVPAVVADFAPGGVITRVVAEAIVTWYTSARAARSIVADVTSDAQ